MSYYTQPAGSCLSGAGEVYPQPYQSYFSIIAKKTATIAAAIFISCSLFSCLPESLAITFSAIVLLGTFAYVLPDSILSSDVYHPEYATPLPWYHHYIFGVPRYVSGFFRRPSTPYTGGHAPVGTGAYTAPYAPPQDPVCPWGVFRVQPSAPPQVPPAASPLSRSARPGMGGPHAPVGYRQ